MPQTLFHLVNLILTFYDPGLMMSPSMLTPGVTWKMPSCSATKLTFNLHGEGARERGRECEREKRSCVRSARALMNGGRLSAQTYGSERETWRTRRSRGESVEREAMAVGGWIICEAWVFAVGRWFVEKGWARWRWSWNLEHKERSRKRYVQK